MKTTINISHEEIALIEQYAGLKDPPSFSELIRVLAQEAERLGIDPRDFEKIPPCGRETRAYNLPSYFGGLRNLREIFIDVAEEVGKRNAGRDWDHQVDVQK